MTSTLKQVEFDVPKGNSKKKYKDGIINAKHSSNGFSIEKLWFSANSDWVSEDDSRTTT